MTHDITIQHNTVHKKHNLQSNTSQHTTSNNIQHKNTQRKIICITLHNTQDTGNVHNMCTTQRNTTQHANNVRIVHKTYNKQNPIDTYHTRTNIKKYNIYKYI